MMRIKQLLAASILIAAPVVSAAAADSRVVDAVRNGNRAALQALIKQHVDVNIPEDDGTTALQ